MACRGPDNKCEAAAVISHNPKSFASSTCSTQVNSPKLPKPSESESQMPCLQGLRKALTEAFRWEGTTAWRWKERLLAGSEWLVTAWLNLTRGSAVNECLRDTSSDFIIHPLCLRLVWLLRSGFLSQAACKAVALRIHGEIIAGLTVWRTCISLPACRFHAGRHQAHYPSRARTGPGGCFCLGGWCTMNYIYIYIYIYLFLCSIYIYIETYSIYIYIYISIHIYIYIHWQHVFYICYSSPLRSRLSSASGRLSSHHYCDLSYCFPPGHWSIVFSIL